MSGKHFSGQVSTSQNVVFTQSRVGIDNLLTPQQATARVGIDNLLTPQQATALLGKSRCQVGGTGQGRDAPQRGAGWQAVLPFAGI